MERISYLLNGQLDAPISPLNRALHYGDGLFETIRCERGKPLFFEQHMQRLLLGCQRLRIPAPDPQILYRESQQLLGQQQHAVLKIIVSRSSSQRGYAYSQDQGHDRLLLLYDYPQYPASLWQNGIKTRICDTRIAHNEQLAGIKHLNRLEHVVARAEWQEADIYEGFLMDNKDLLVEACMSNVFLVKQGELLTPGLSRCGVAGIMRECIVNLAGSWGIQVKIEDLPIDRLYSADEVFVSNSVIGIWPVKQVNQQPFLVGALTQKFQTAVQNLMDDQ